MRGHTELADGVHQLSVQPGINCWVVVEPEGTTLIDAGLDRPGLIEKLAALGVAVTDVRRVLLTHGHPDHAGGVTRLRRAGSPARVEVGRDDLATVHGTAPQPSADPASRLGRLLDRLPHPGAWGRRIELPDATPLEDGARLDVAGGIQVLATPGHTPGHVAYHLEAHDLLIGGDAVFNVFRLRPAPPLLCWRAGLNRTAIARLAAVGAGTLALAHGRAVTDDVSGRLATLVADDRR